MPAKTSAGARDCKVQIQKLTETIGASREPVESWDVERAITLDASREDMVLPESSRERFVAGQISARGETRWGCPYHPDIDPDLVDVVKKRRLVHGRNVYDITAVERIGRKNGFRLVTLVKAG